MTKRRPGDLDSHPTVSCGTPDPQVVRGPGNHDAFPQQVLPVCAWEETPSQAELGKTMWTYILKGTPWDGLFHNESLLPHPAQP